MNVNVAQLRRWRCARVVFAACCAAAKWQKNQWAQVWEVELIHVSTLTYKYSYIMYSFNPSWWEKSNVCWNNNSLVDYDTPCTSAAVVLSHRSTSFCLGGCKVWLREVVAHSSILRRHLWPSLLSSHLPFPPLLLLLLCPSWPLPTSLIALQSFHPPSLFSGRCEEMERQIEGRRKNTQKDSYYYWIILSIDKMLCQKFW